MKSLLLNFVRLPSWAVFLFLVAPFFMMHMTPFSSLIAAIVLSVWLFACFFTLKSKIPKKVIISPVWFLTRLIYAIVYMSALEILFNGQVMTSLTLFHIIAVISIFSCLFSVAQVLVICEEKSKQRFDKYIGTFFLFWFYPIGVWFIHPRVKEIR